jgi:hypothetical protein
MPGTETFLESSLLSWRIFDGQSDKAGIVWRGLTKINEERNTKP